MSSHPILLLRPPKISPRSSPKGKVNKGPFYPPDAQWTKHGPILKSLRDSLKNESITISKSNYGIDPEYALVVETIEPVQNLLNATKKIKDLELLRESDIEAFDSDEITSTGEATAEDEPKKIRNHRLFFMMTNHAAIDQLINLFEKWKSNPTMEFDIGLTPFRDLFGYVETIRRWSIEERVRETGILEDWKARNESNDKDLPFEAELWYRSDRNKRQNAEANVVRQITGLGGKIIKASVINDINYHFIVGQIPARAISELKELEELSLFRCEDVCYFRPTAQISAKYGDNTEPFEIDLEAEKSPVGDPIIALLDGLPVEKHRFLDGRLIVDDPDNYSSGYEAAKRRHGTNMASLICHGDLAAYTRSISRPIYVRPIMKPDSNSYHWNVEKVPETESVVDLVHRAVRRIFESSNGEKPAAPTVRVINLSLGDPSLPFYSQISALARLIDWLAWKYKVLFLVSAGNHSGKIELESPRDRISELQANPNKLQEEFITALVSNTRNMRLLSPSEAINVLTVGALHLDESQKINANNLIDPYPGPDIWPSPVNAHGPGAKRCIKPEILVPGGRSFYKEKQGNAHTNVTLSPVNSTQLPGLKCAMPDHKGNLSLIGTSSGTSCSTALASRAAMLIYEDVLGQLITNNEIPDDYTSVMLKTLLVHASRWDASHEVFSRVLQSSPLKKNVERHKRRNFLSRFFGFGRVDLARVISCTDTTVTAIGFGTLDHNMSHVYSFPLPPSLSSIRCKRHFIVTLGWFTPIMPQNQKYKAASLKLKCDKDIAGKTIDNDFVSTARGTVIHVLYEKSAAQVISDGDELNVTIECQIHDNFHKESIPYGLAVTLEIEDSITVPIYNEIAERIKQRIEIA